MKKRLLTLGILSCLASQVFCSTNLGFAYDDNVLWSYWKHKQDSLAEEEPKEHLLSAGVNFEYGFEGKGRNQDRTKVNIAQTLSPKESYLHSMDNSTDPEVLTAQLEKFFHPPLMFTNSNGEVLEYSLEAKKVEGDVNFWLSLDAVQGKLGQIALSAYLPIKIIKVRNLEASLTALPDAMQEVLDGVPELKEELDDLAMLTYKNLAGLRIDRIDNGRPWGDLHFMLSWNRNVEFLKLKDAWFNIFAQVGVTAPTADPRQTEHAFAVPRGNDNAVGVPFTVSLNGFFRDNFRACVAGDFLFLASEKSTRRLRKSADQTELLISDKVKVKRNPGMIYRATTILEAKTSDQIYSALLAWQFLHKRADKFSEFETSGYSKDIVEASQRWGKKDHQSLIAQVGMDFKSLTKSPIAPRISAFYKLPIRGRRIELFHSIGVNIGFDF